MKNPVAIVRALTLPRLTARVAAMVSVAAFLSTALIQGAWAQTAPALGAASGFSVLGGWAVTCTGPGSVIGDVGVGSGSGGAFTNTPVCTITGGTPPATDAAAGGALTAFLGAYAAVQSKTCTGQLLSAYTIATTGATLTLTPGVYCNAGNSDEAAGVAFTGTTLILDAQGNANAVWIFKISGAGGLTGTNFSVVMINGGQPCNVFWAPSAAATMTDSAFSGNILAGNTTLGSITLTRGTLAGRALADVAVTMTNASVIGCSALTPTKGKHECDGDNEGNHGDKDHEKCNQGVGNGPEGCDPGKSNLHNPYGSNDENGGRPGDPGRKGGNK